MVKIQLGSDGEDSNPAEDGVPRQASEPLGEVKVVFLLTFRRFVCVVWEVWLGVFTWWVTRVYQNYLILQHQYLIMSHIRVNKVYYETRALLSSANSQIYDKEIYEHVKLIISYKSVMDSNTFLFESASPKYVKVKSSRLKLYLCKYK